MIRIVKSAKRQSELLGAFDAGIVRHRAERNYQHVIRNGLGTVYQCNFASIEIYSGDFSANEPCPFKEQSFVVRRKVPGLYSPTQVLIATRLDKAGTLTARRREAW